MWCRYIFWIWRYVFIRHVTPQDHSVVLSCIFMAESSLQHVTSLKNLVTIDILIVNRKMLHQKNESCKYFLPLKNWVNWITTTQEKMTQPQKCTFWEEVPKNYKTYFSIWLPSITLFLKQYSVELKRLLSPFWKLKMSMMLLCMFGLFILQQKQLKICNIK